MNEFMTAVGAIVGMLWYFILPTAAGIIALLLLMDWVGA